MNAEGTNTAHSTSAIAISAVPTSSMLRIDASRGFKPAAMLRSTFSTTTMASSTTMPTASTRPNSDRLLSEKPKVAIRKKVPISDTGMAIKRDDRGAPGLQEQHDHQHHQQDRFEDGLLDRFDRLPDELRRVVDDLVGDAGREALRQNRPSSRGWRSRWQARSSPGAERSPKPLPDRGRGRSSTNSPGRPIRPVPMSLSRTTASAVCLITTLANSSGSDSRPSVCTEIWKARL